MANSLGFPAPASSAQGAGRPNSLNRSENSPLVITKPSDIVKCEKGQRHSIVGMIYYAKGNARAAGSRGTTRFRVGRSFFHQILTNRGEYLLFQWINSTGEEFKAFKIRDLETGADLNVKLWHVAGKTPPPSAIVEGEFILVCNTEIFIHTGPSSEGARDWYSRLQDGGSFAVFDRSLNLRIGEKSAATDAAKQYLEERVRNLEKDSDGNTIIELGKGELKAKELQKPPPLRRIALVQAKEEPSGSNYELIVKVLYKEIWKRPTNTVWQLWAWDGSGPANDYAGPHVHIKRSPQTGIPQHGLVLRISVWPRCLHLLPEDVNAGTWLKISGIMYKDNPGELQSRDNIFSAEEMDPNLPELIEHRTMCETLPDSTPASTDLDFGSMQIETHTTDHEGAHSRSKRPSSAPHYAQAENYSSAASPSPSKRVAAPIEPNILDSNEEECLLKGIATPKIRVLTTNEQAPFTEPSSLLAKPIPEPGTAEPFLLRGILKNIYPLPSESTHTDYMVEYCTRCRKIRAEDHSPCGTTPQFASTLSAVIQVADTEGYVSVIAVGREAERFFKISCDGGVKAPAQFMEKMSKLEDQIGQLVDLFVLAWYTGGNKPSYRLFGTEFDSS